MLRGLQLPLQLLAHAEQHEPRISTPMHAVDTLLYSAAVTCIDGRCLQGPRPLAAGAVPHGATTDVCGHVQGEVVAAIKG